MSSGPNAPKSESPLDDPTVAERMGRSESSAAGTDGESGSHPSFESQTFGSQGATSSQSFSTGSDSHSGTRSPIEHSGAALRKEEIGRLHFFSMAMIGMCVFGYLLVPLIDGHPKAEPAMLATITVSLLGFIYAYWATASVERYRPGIVGFVAQVQGVSCMGAGYYFGVFSPFSALVSIVILLYCLGALRRYAVAIYLEISVCYGVLAGLISLGRIPDYGLVRGDGLELQQKLLLMLAVELIFFLAFVLGQASYEKAEAAVEELEEAVRAVTQREALLNEARADLERAAGFGEPGRFTEQVLGSYKLGVVIGRGAMGEIYDAVPVGGGEAVAVKLLHRSAIVDPAHVARFVREARIAASIQAENVVQVLEVGDVDSPLPYFAMELLEGDDLAIILRDKRRLSMRRVRSLVQQVALGLEAAREAGVVHRDLKPHNIFRCRRDSGDPVWKILDFGVSKLATDAANLTHGHLVGTPAYMAPEQAVDGGAVDHRADVYALAIITYRALTGQPAFAGRDIAKVIRDAAERLPAAPSSLVHLPSEVDLVLAVGMAKRPVDRFARAADFSRAFDAALAGKIDETLAARAEALLTQLPWEGRQRGED